MEDYWYALNGAIIHVLTNQNGFQCMYISFQEKDGIINNKLII